MNPEAEQATARGEKPPEQPPVSQGVETVGRRKTEEELRAQVALVNIHRSFDYRHAFAVPDEWYLLPEDELKERVEARRDQMSREGTPTGDEYSEYVYALQRLRQEQQPQVAAALDKAGDDPQARREAITQALQFSGKAQGKFLERLQDVGSRDERMFTDEQLQEARESSEAFSRLLLEGMRRKPENAVSFVDELAKYVSPEDLRLYCETMAEQHPFMFLSYFEKMTSILPQEEHRPLVESAARKEPSAVLHYLRKDALQKLFTPEECHAMLVSAMQISYLGSLKKETLDPIVEAGLLTPEDIRTALLERLRRDGSAVDSITECLDYFPPEDRGKLHAAALEAFTRKDNPASSFLLAKLQEILTPEEQAGILRQMLKAKGNDVGYYLEECATLLPKEEFQQLIRTAIEQRSRTLFMSYFSIDLVLGSDRLEEHDKDALVAFVVQEHPNQAMSHLPTLIAHFPEKKRGAVIRDLITRTSATRSLSMSNHWLSTIAASSDEEKQELSALIERIPSGEFLEYYTSERQCERFKELFSHEEIQALLDERITQGTIKLSATLVRSLRKFLGSDEALKVSLERILEKDPAQFVSTFDSIQYLYTSEEVQSRINQLAHDRRGSALCFVYIKEWAPVTGDIFARTFIRQYGAANAGPTLGQLRECLPLLSPSERVPFVEQLVHINPAFALAESENIRGLLPEMTDEAILALAEHDERRLAFAPKTLRERMKKIRSAEPKSANWNALAIDAAELYESIAIIQGQGFDDEFLALRQEREIPAREERDFLSVFECFALLREKSPERFAHLHELGSTMAEIRSTLMQEVAARIGVTDVVTKEASERFFTAMETPTPFLVYLLQHEESAEHKGMLQEMFQAVLQGRFAEWKYGPDTAEGLQDLQAKSLLPSQLTLPQYQRWREDGATSLQESLAPDAGRVAQEVQRLLMENQEHLAGGIPLREELFTPGGQSVLQETLRSVGGELRSVAQQMTEAAKANDQETLAQLSTAKARLETQRDQYKAQQLLFRLLTLKPKEVASGYLLEGEKLEKKTMKIEQVLAEVSKRLPEPDRFIIDRVRQYLTSYQSASSSVEDLSCSDTGDPKTLLEIGAKPVGSCQHYRHGSLNECLLGYADPDTKILMLRNERGNPVARCIFRLLSLPDGSPALHLERVYAATPGAGVMRGIITHAVQKAKAMGIPLYMSYEAQEADDEQPNTSEEGALPRRSELPKGIRLVSTPTALASKASRAPLVYVDSAGGVTSGGQYEIHSLFQILEEQQATPKTSSSAEGG